MTSTQFNPFGEHETALKIAGNALDRICEIFVKELDEPTTKQNGLSVESKDICGVLEELGNIVKKIHESAVQSLLSEIVASLSKFIENLSQKSEKLRPSDMMVLSRTVSKFIQIIADRIAEPFNSERLEEWAPLFESLVTSKIILLKDVGIVLWKATFAKVKTSLRYPGQLRQALEKLPKKNGIVLPADEKKSGVSPMFDTDEEEAMDGMGGAPGAADASQSLSQSSFQFSQQPFADEMAERLLREQKKQVEVVVEKEKEATTPRRRQSKLSLLDEDSCDFVAITTTPTSANRKNRLTDRQKEKLMEAAAPRTTTNYVDEESQSGFQKTAQIKAALSAMNYDVGEESVSVCFPKVEVKVEAVPQELQEIVEERKESEEETNKRASKRNRKLFEDSPAKLPAPSSTSSVPEPFEKEEKSEESPQEAETETVAESEEPPKKRIGRPKKTPKRAGSNKRPLEKETSSESIAKSPERKKTPKDVKAEKIPRRSTRASMRKTEEVPDDVKVVEPTPSEVVVETVPEVVPKNDTEVVPEVVPEVKVSEVVKESTEELEASPPKTPRTPSILRTSRRAGDGAMTPSILRRLDSPLTEKKRNRVHFGEESLDMPSSTPNTPRRTQKVLTVDVKSPEKTPGQKSVDLSEHPMGLLEIEDPSSSTSPFFRSLVGCNDPIERVVRNLAPLCLKTAVDAVKKSLQSAGVRTVGEFAALSKKQIGELNGLKHPKEKCARSVLAEYEAKKRAEVRASEERIVAEASPLKQMPKIFEDVETAEKVETVEEKKAEEIQQAPEETPIDVQAPPQEVPIEVEPEVMDPKPSTPAQVVQPVETVKEPVLNALQPSESPASSVSPAPEAPEAPVEVRKNLIPIFDKTKVKKEVASPQKAVIQRKQKTSHSMTDDSRLLHRICSNLSRAHSLNQLPSEKWTGLMDAVNKSAILFKNIVQERGSRLAEWDDADVENDDVAHDDVLAPEDDVKSLRAVYRRISRHHALGDVDDATWQAVMETVNEAACLLRSIVVERAPR